MGLFTQINLNKPPNGVFYGGETVSGMIRYELYEPMEVEQIVVSLKGMGYLKLRERNNRRNRRHVGREIYADIDQVIQEGKTTVPTGCYKTRFDFILPEHVPSSFRYEQYIPRYAVYCKIKYYIRIKFARPGWFSFAKHFRKEIIVASTIIPKLPMEPAIYGQRRKLVQPFSSKTSTVIMKANVVNSVIPIGGKIEIQSEIQNDTNVDIKKVKVKLMEKHTFKVRGHRKVKAYEDFPGSDYNTEPILSQATQNIPIDIVVPLDMISLDHSSLVSRDYLVRIKAQMPMPYRDVVLNIPVQIGELVQREEVAALPPSYWEAMGEAKKDDDDDESDEEAYGGESGEKS